MICSHASFITSQPLSSPFSLSYVSSPSMLTKEQTFVPPSRIPPQQPHLNITPAAPIRLSSLPLTPLPFLPLIPFRSVSMPCLSWRSRTYRENVIGGPGLGSAVHHTLASPDHILNLLNAPISPILSIFLPSIPAQDALRPLRRPSHGPEGFFGPLFVDHHLALSKAEMHSHTYMPLGRVHRNSSHFVSALLVRVTGPDRELVICLSSLYHTPSLHRGHTFGMHSSLDLDLSGIISHGKWKYLTATTARASNILQKTKM
ncbi:hypothetical protein GE09DRAFT_53204 [Coniochaeta sp. 2T2.1]|nr:hypothetical protein GE09DRAFT_53204 [Coniochaeta sp. 2T2.1]